MPAGLSAITLTGLPEPLTIFNGTAITAAPVNGRRSRLVRLANPNLPWPCVTKWLPH